MYCGRRDFKTAAYKAWERDFLYLLNQQEPQRLLAELRNAFIPGKHCYRVRIIWYSPQLLTKDGTLSNKTFDVTNVEKALLDLICLPKYHVQEWPYGCPNLNIDDKHVLTLVSGKRGSSAGWEIGFTIWLEELKKYV